MRELSFGERRLSLLDKIIFFLRIRRIKKYLHDCGVVVDTGCGYRGRLLKWILDHYKIEKGIGIDLSVDEDLKIPKMVLLKSDLNGDLPIETGLADFVISTAVIEHLSNSPQYVKEIARVLKSGGELVITTPSKLAKPILEFMAFKLHVINTQEIKDHKYYFSLSELKQLLIGNGFKEENIKSQTFLFGLNDFIYARKN